jgi:molybdopterin/thiamine biosynthesis adenylyltransferase
VSYQPWFERWPELLDWELARFSELRLPALVDEEARDAGRLEVRSEVLFAGEPVPIAVRYPDEYPELPPVVFGPEDLLTRHEHPFNGSFCLLERPLDDWKASAWGGADLVADRLLALLSDSERGPHAVRATEAPMPEPYGAYYEYPLGPVVVMDQALVSPPEDTGTFRLRLFHPDGLRFVVESVGPRESRSDLLNVVPGGPSVVGRFIRVEGNPPGPDARAVYRWIRTNAKTLMSQPVPPKLAASRRDRGAPADVAALIFSEEGPAVGEVHDAWLFLVRPAQGDPILVHHQIASPEERFRRAPELSPLEGKRAVVVGLGTIGGSVALELVKAGIGGIDLIDYDRFEVGNSIRHVVGLDYAGLAKTVGMDIACRQMNPFCDVTGHSIQLGRPNWMDQPNLEDVTRMFERADIVIDATGSHQVQALLARLAAEAGTAFLSAWLTDGYWGAEVFRLIPRVTRCHKCLLTAMRDGSVTVLHAESGPDEPVVAQGCSHPTVAGAGFDASELSALAARLAVQTLLRFEDAYPDSPWDHAVLNFRRMPSDEHFPRFAAERLEPTDACLICDAAVGSTALPSRVSF